MRAAARTALAVLCLAPAAGGRAAEKEAPACTFEVALGDVVARRGDVVVEAGRTVRDAIALEGSVVVHRGATVRNAVAVGGSVRLEEGARVTGSALALGGEVRLAPGAVLEGSRLTLTDALEVVDARGERVHLSLEVGGRALGQWVLGVLLAGLRPCAPAEAEERTR